MLFIRSRPDRVLVKCQVNRSYAIAHGVDSTWAKRWMVVGEIKDMGIP